jgi:hypothetical protein
MKSENSKPEASSDASSPETPSFGAESKAKQPTLDFVPEYENYAGVAHEFTGTLFVPAPGESERLAKERPKEQMNVVGSKPVIFTLTEPRGNRFAKSKDDFTKVKLDLKTALGLRAKGQ